MTGFCEKRLWVGVEDARGGVIAVSRDGTYAVALVGIDSRLVVAVDYGGATVAAKNLGDGVDGEFVPGEAAVDAICCWDGKQRSVG